MKPNILLIITDHHAWFDHFGPSRTEISFENWDRFCSEGVRFNRAQAICPLCTPARTSMMTGQYPSRHGMLMNTEAQKGKHRQCDIRSETPLYSHYLSEAGYRNAYVGKWHCDANRVPVDYGIEGWSLPHYGKPYMSDRYKAYCEERGLGEARARIERNLNHPEWTGQTLTLHDDSPWRFMNGSGVLLGHEDAHDQNFVAHLAEEKVRTFAKDSQPWSLVASFWGPHQPYYPSESYAGKVDPKSIPPYPTFDDDLQGKPLRHFVHRDLVHCQPRKQWPEWEDWQPVLARNYEQQLQLDASIGRLLDSLEETGQAENTIVIWQADHGDALASHGGLWDKNCTMTQEVMHIPMAVRWPGRASAGKTCEKLVSNMDCTATMLAAAGIDTPESMDSRSLVPLCEDVDDRSWSDQLVCEHHGHGEEITQRMVISGRYKYVAAIFDGDELYDLADDPNETKNLIESSDHAHICNEMRQRLIDHIKKTDDRVAKHRLLYALERQV